MQAYLLDGPLGLKLPTVASLQPQLAAAAAIRSKSTPAAPQMRPPIRPGSAMLQVDPGLGLRVRVGLAHPYRAHPHPSQVDPDCSKSGVKIYVDAHNLAYNAVCNQFDIQTGVNKFWKIQLLQVGVRSRSSSSSSSSSSSNRVACETQSTLPYYYYDHYCCCCCCCCCRGRPSGPSTQSSAAGGVWAATRSSAATGVGRRRAAT